MNEIEENGVTEEKKPFKVSWRKICSWLSLVLSILAPLAAIGLSIVCIAQAEEDEKTEVKLITMVSIVVGTILFLNEFILNLFMA